MELLKKICGVGMELSRYTVTSEKLPAGFDGFRIMHLSDFHCKPKKNIISCVVSEKPDIIVITGDMTDEHCEYGSFEALLRALLRHAPVYMVSGNHDCARADFGRLLKRCRAMGGVYLINESAELRRGGDSIVIHGLDDPGAKAETVADRKIAEGLGCLARQSTYEILLFHRANKLPKVLGEGFDLILSGHMHGGQLRLPYFGGVVAPKSCIASNDRLLFPDYSGGFFDCGGTDVIVNRGMGNPVPLPRVGNPTEVVCITLKKGLCEKERAASL